MAPHAAIYDEYLESNMRAVLEGMVEALLLTKPKDVHEFCIDWLLQWHKDHDDEQEELKKLTAERDHYLLRRANLLQELQDLTGGGGSSSSSAPAPRAPSQGAARQEECSAEDMAAAEAAEQEKIAKMKACDRRAGVSAPAVTEERMKQWKKPFFEKPQDVRSRIKDMISASEKLQVLFGHLTDDAVYDVIDAMAPQAVEAGSNLIAQGEEGDNFYIVDEGSFDVFVKRGDGPPGKVLEYSAGDMFGELALMYNAPRAATVTATSESNVWALDRESFQLMLTTAENTKRSHYEDFLSNIEIFKALTKYELAQLSDMLDSSLFDAGEDIVTQGEEGSKFYIIEDGEAKAYIHGDEGEVEVKHYQVPGEFFGEVALITQSTRKATVRAVGTGCSVLSVDREDFDRVLGPIKDLLEANIDKYPAYADILQAATQ